VSQAVERHALLLVVRHGITEWNAEQRWQGLADIALSEEGERQAALAATNLASQGVQFGRVVASDLVRAFRTAEVLAGALPNALTVERDSRWRERDVGPWSGKTTDEIEAAWPGQLSAWRRGEDSDVNGVEPHLAFEKRLSVVLDDWLDVAQRSAEPILIVAHGGVLRGLDRVVGSDPGAFGNLSGRWFGLDRHGQARARERVHLLDGHHRTGTSL
jgi:glucosyl-3-phosphoglycerate phosphatase